MKILFFFLSLSLSLNILARSWSGDYKTNIKCNIENYREAKNCMIRLANYMPTGNDANAVLVTRSKRSKTLMNELLNYMNHQEDEYYVERANYLAVVVQNDDEENIYYYALSNGINVTPKLLGYSLPRVDIGYDFCSDDFKSLRKFMNPDNLFLGMNFENSLNGVIWFTEDMDCDYL